MLIMEIVPNALYTTANLADILDVNLQTVQKLLQNGELPGFKVGRRWYVVGRDLLAMGQAKGAGNDDTGAASDPA